MKEHGKERALFEGKPILKSIARLAIPTMVGQIILVVYNIADTFFIGLTGNDAKLTAVTICMPAFMFLSAISNLFGVGGAAAISRALDRRNAERAKCAASFCFWGCLLTWIVYALGARLFWTVSSTCLAGVTLRARAGAQLHDGALLRYTHGPCLHHGRMPHLLLPVPILSRPFFRILGNSRDPFGLIISFCAGLLRGVIY